eukprot:SAG11_NODE_342_length_10454_cov_11.233079_5_plen_65_part_00
MANRSDVPIRFKFRYDNFTAAVPPSVPGYRTGIVLYLGRTNFTNVTVLCILLATVYRVQLLYIK